MSPQIALHDPVFRAYFAIVLVSLAVGGAVLGFLRFILKRDTASMFQTYWSWILMAGIGLLVVFLGRIPTIVGVTLLAIYAFKEFARASGLYRDWWMTGAVYAGIIAVGVASLISHRRGEEPGPGWYGLFMAVPVFAIALILLIPILRNCARGELQRMSLAIIGFVYIGWMFGHLGFLANARSAYGFLCFIIFATAVSDVAAFTFGKIFGRHPLRSEISPNKTWEGALGAFAVATIPGHGGILDRIDSLIYAAPLFMHMAGYYFPLK
jgi:phosphatidate cytidylyltransferase